MKNKFCTIILAANFVTSSALFCGNDTTTASTVKAPAATTAPATTPTPAAPTAAVAQPGLLSQALDLVKGSWTNHRNWYYGAGALAVVSAVVVAHKKGKLPRCLQMSFCKKKDKSS